MHLIKARAYTLALIFLLVAAVITRAEETKPPALQIDVYDSEYDSAELKGLENAKVRSHGHEDKVLPRETRERIFSQIPGLPEVVKNWDELDRDLLLLRASHQSSKKLKSLYPKIPSGTLQSLQTEAKKAVHAPKD